LLLHDPQATRREAEPAPVQLREVWVDEADGERRHLPLSPEVPPEVVLAGGATFFSFAALDLDRPDATRYRGRLRGEESDFSGWDAASSYTYFGLGPGTYTLEVQARDRAGRISQMRPYTLTVLPRWFESGLFVVFATLILLVLVGLLLRGFARRRIERVWRQNAVLEREVAERTEALAEANRRLRTMADLDGLTGIANRRRLDEYLPLAWARCADRERPLALLLVDVDRFKQYNDQHGHLAGDELIRRVADLLRTGLRRSEDLVARFGGEEFLIVLPGATLDVASGLAENLRADAERGLDGSTVSIGVAAAEPGPEVEYNLLIERADAALYRAKKGGRNRVELDTGVE
jgi:diguanylate cyclase (GGDEF)-like protein